MVQVRLDRDMRKVERGQTGVAKEICCAIMIVLSEDVIL